MSDCTPCLSAGQYVCKSTSTSRYAFCCTESTDTSTSGCNADSRGTLCSTSVTNTYAKEMTCPLETSKCGSTTQYTVLPTVATTATVTTSSFTSASICYYQFTADNTTFTDTVNYAWSLDFAFNNYYTATVVFLNGTEIESASDAVTVTSVDQTFTYSAHDGNTVFLYVKGTASAP